MSVTQPAPMFIPSEPSIHEEYELFTEEATNSQDETVRAILT